MLAEVRLKASQWRILCNIYVPIAFVTLWGDHNGSDSWAVLDHTMSLFQAVTLACRQAMSIDRADTYRTYLKYYVDHLRNLFPHTIRHQRRSNLHVAFHIYDFLLFGPVMSWWCFSLERLIGSLQKVNTNCHIGGMSLTYKSNHSTRFQDS